MMLMPSMAVTTRGGNEDKDEVLLNTTSTMNRVGHAVAL
jgi:hypothetical protein